jgi:hypothetical protein
MNTLNLSLKWDGHACLSVLSLEALACDAA